MKNLPKTMTKDKVEKALKHALDSFVKDDEHLLAADASERSMSYQIAHHLAEQMEGDDVDCEYNRDGFNVKQLELADEQVSSEAEEAVTVFPDIIVHRRGNNKYNLLVIEMKKAASRNNSEHDRKKLRAFLKHLRYKWTVFLIIGKESNGKLVRTLEWMNGQNEFERSNLQLGKLG